MSVEELLEMADYISDVESEKRIEELRNEEMQRQAEEAWNDQLWQERFNQLAEEQRIAQQKGNEWTTTSNTIYTATSNTIDSNTFVAELSNQFQKLFGK